MRTWPVERFTFLAMLATVAPSPPVTIPPAPGALGAGIAQPAPRPDPTADERDAEARTVLLALPTEEGVGLRWAWPEGGEPAVGYHVERLATDEVEWRRLTAEPLARVRDPAEARRRLGAAYDRYEPLLFPARPVRTRDVALSRLGLLLLSADLDPALARALGLRYDDREAESGRAYRYRLIAVGSDGEEVVATSGTVIAGAYQPAPAPDELRAEQSGEYLLLSWSLHIPYTAYHVFRDGRRLNAGPVVPFEVEGRAGARASPFQFRDTTVALGDTVTYSVEGIDALGRAGRRSNPVTVIVRDRMPPEPPPIVQAETRGDTVAVRWEPPPDADVASYRLWAADAREGPFEEVGALVPAPRTEAFDPGNSPGRILWYHVTAIDSAGNESRPSLTAMAHLPDLQPPASPAGLEGDASAGRAELRWRAAADPDLRGYRVYRASSPDREFGLLTPRPLAKTAFVDTLRLGADHDFHYRVTAVDSAYNESEPAGPIALRPPDVKPPQAPIVREIEAGDERLIVRWLANPDPDVVGYLVRHRRPGESRWTERPDTLRVGAHTDTIAGVPARTPIEVTVVAIDDAGNASAPSESVTGEAYTRRAPPPVEIERAVYHPDSGTVRIEWDEPAAEVERVVVLRRDPGTDDFRVIGRAQPGAGRLEDAGVRPGLTYEYVLRIFDRNGFHSDARTPIAVSTAKPSL